MAEKKTFTKDPETVIEDLIRDSSSDSNKESTGEDLKLSDTLNELNVNPHKGLRDSENVETNCSLEEKLAASNELKTEGNICFKSSRFEESIEAYTKALNVCPESCKQERAVLYGNRAAAKIKLGLQEEGLKDCDLALELNPQYCKVLQRRAALYEALEKLDEAHKDYQSILEIEPSNHDARAEVYRLSQEIEKRNEKMKEEMLGKLKDLGNSALKFFGLSLNDFKVQQDPKTGSYSVSMNK